MDYSYQLYSARNEKSLDDTLNSLRSIGYTQVEGWGGQFDDPAAMARSLKNASLTMPTAHLSYVDLEDTARTIDIARTVGIETIFCPAPPPADYREGNGNWAELAAGLARIGAALKAGGVGFGYHNHSWEFETLADGRTPIELILASPDVQWEMDLAWIVKAGGDPRAWMDKLGSRITAIHVKDIAPAGEKLDEDGWADVGTGTLDWAQIIKDARAKTSVRFLVMEHDKPSDPMRFARTSINSARQWG